MTEDTITSIFESISTFRTLSKLGDYQGVFCPLLEPQAPWFQLGLHLRGNRFFLAFPMRIYFSTV